MNGRAVNDQSLGVITERPPPFPPLQLKGQHVFSYLRDNLRGYLSA